MLLKLIQKYLRKKGLVAVTLYDAKNIVRYRSTRGELKHLTEDYNKLVECMAHYGEIKELKELLVNKGIKITELPDKKAELQNMFTETYTKTFKKRK